MTTINLHGLLAFEFGNSMQIYLRKAKEVFNAIDANKNNFSKRLLELSQNGLQYSIIVDGSNIKTLEELQINKPPKVIDLVPAICGQGAIIAAVGAVAAIGGGLAISSGTLLAGSFAMFAAQMAVSIGIGLIGMGIQMMLAPKPEPLERPAASIGTASALSQSFFFSSRVNSAQQGLPVPVGYGRLRVGSLVIQNSISSYSASIPGNKATTIDDDLETIRKSSQNTSINSRLIT
jgi:predicted phage tail protein